MKFPSRKNNFEIDNLTTDEFNTEWEYRRIERLGILIDCEREATLDEMNSAAICADGILAF